MWAQRFDDPTSLDEFFAAGRKMGFDVFEVGPVAGTEAVRGLHAGGAIQSVHSPCPGDTAPPGASFLVPDAHARADAGVALLESVRLAAGLGARAVVFHLGKLEGDEVLAHMEFELSARTLAGQANEPLWCVARDRLVAAVAEREEAALPAATSALRPVCDAARALGVELAFETGYYPLELPTPDGARRLLADLASHGLSAWLDTGHVAARERRGLGGFGSWSEAVRGRWTGVHVHDAVGLRDHLAPGSGELDFGAVLAILPPRSCVTLEVDWYLTEDEVTNGLALVNGVLAALW
jgi:sugar phosphate isomerase/epimerase